MIGLQTLIFVDDLLRGAKNMNCLRSGYVKLDYVLKEVLGDIEVKNKKKKKDSYLRDKLCSEGLRACIEARVRDRPAMIKGSRYM